QDAAGAVRGVLAEADVGHEREPRGLSAHLAQRALHRAGVVPGRRTLFVLVVGQAEKEHSPDAAGVGLGRQGAGHVGGDVTLAGERRDRAIDAAAAHDEERLNEVRRTHARLAHEAAKTLGTSQAAHANFGETHGSKPRWWSRSVAAAPGTHEMGGPYTHIHGEHSPPCNTPVPTSSTT